MAYEHVKDAVRQAVRRVWRYLVLAALLAAAGAVVWPCRDHLRSPQALYREAKTATPRRAARLYALMAKKMPELEEYCHLWSAQARLPAFEAVETLHKVARYRPDSPAAYHAHLTLARYYASIESFETDDEYLAALALDDTVEARLELARYLEEQNDRAGAYKQYRAMIGLERPDAFAGMRRTAPDAVTVAGDLLGSRYCSDALEALRHVDSCEAHCLRGRALRCLGLDDEVAAEEAACQECSGGERVESAEAENLGEKEQRLLNSDDPVDWWRATWDMDVQKRYTDVVPIYLRIAESDVYVSDDAAYRAWVLARRELRDPKVQETALSLLRSMQPNWLAWRATNTLDWETPPAFPQSAVDALTRDVLRKVVALESIGREDLAYQELRFTAMVSETPEVVLKMAEELSARGHIVPACSLALPYLVDHPYAALGVWGLGYPPAYADQLNLRARQYGVEPELVWAVMRQETLFQAELVSRAGARGLMQIMGELQSDTCKEIGVGCVPGDAFRPGPSIHIGTYYLSRLLDYYDGDLDLVIMAYNAGPGAVDQWTQDPAIKDRDDLLRFAWYGETREYLERVSLDYMIYKELYGDD